MARLASEEKAGFYPTPPSQVGLVARRLRAEPGHVVNVLDPCCGEGDALAEMASALRGCGAEVSSYGIELERARALEAKKKLDHAVCSPYEDARVTPGAFSFLWLNPPYMQRGRERAEVAFLRDLTDWSGGKLQAGGLLGYCVPQSVLSAAAAILAMRFDGLKVYRFTDPEFAAYRQVVVFGYRRAEKNPDPYPLRDALRRAALEDLPALDAADGAVFAVPPSAKGVAVFRSGALTEDEVRESLRVSPLWGAARRFDPRPAAAMGSPLLPLKLAHVAVAIAAGAVDGNMGSHLLVGSTAKVRVESPVESDGGVKVVERTETRSVIRLFDPGGVHVLA